jgi:DNA-binding IclR family transcriptional regulator
MGCVNADGTLVSSARRMLEALAAPRPAEEIAALVEQPLYKVRSGLRELAQAGLIREDGKRYLRTESGAAVLKRP